MDGIHDPGGMHGFGKVERDLRRALRGRRAVLAESEFVSLITRDALIGVAQVKAPE